MIDGEKLLLEVNDSDFFIPHMPMSWCECQLPRAEEKGARLVAAPPMNDPRNLATPSMEG